ncbi:PucR family transcriptional regulator [Paenibacillus cellulositrophicus]|uniref:PucR family transcriptional regulator n=1 Tax=Paenibacillus cellulositrophicus TaxID=562959 RepID=UPI00126771B7|nr:PucR family transcriptional regulator [Paenibacillus cellulositrophicus]
MYLTIEDALTIYPLSEGKLTAGRSGLNRIVKSVNVMDAPDISDWVREGDILFTTAYLIKDNPADGVRLLQKLVDKGAAGIGIKLGRFWASVPDEMLQEADRLGFPLIELPFPFTFSDQMKGLFNAELQKNTLLLQNVLDKQKELIRFALSPVDTGRLFDRIREILGVPLAVTGMRGQTLFSTLTTDEMQLLKKRQLKDTPQWLRCEQGRLLCVPLKSPGQEHDFNSRAIFRLPPGIPMKEEEGLYHQAAEIIGYHLNAVERNDLTQSTQNEFAAMLKNYLKQQVSAEALVACASSHGIPFGSDSFQCVLTTCDPEYTGRADHLLKSVKQEFHYHPMLKDLSPLHFQLENTILSIFPSELPRSSGKLPQLLTRVFFELAAKAGRHLRMTVSHIKTRPDQLEAAYRECQNARDTAARLNLDAFVVEFANVEISYIFQSVPVHKMRQFVEMALAPLQDRAPDSAQELLRTLELYMANNGQIHETAKQLFIHRNTAAYRLEKISELLQVDFKDYHHLLRLKLVLMFRDMLRT